MVGHQTIGQDIHPILGTIGLPPGQIHLPIVIREKHVLAETSPLERFVERSVFKRIVGRLPFPSQLRETCKHFATEHNLIDVAHVEHVDHAA